MKDEYTEKVKKAESIFDQQNYRKAQEIYTTIIKEAEFESANHEHKSAIYYNLALCHEFIAKDLPNQSQQALVELNSAKKNYDLSKKFSDDNLKSIKQIDYQILQIFILQLEHYQSVTNLEKVSEIIELALQCINPYIKHLDDDFKKILTIILDIKLNYLCKRADSTLDKKQYEEATKIYVKALEVQEELLKLLKDDTSLMQQKWTKADILYNMGQANKKMLRFEDALKMYSESKMLYKVVVDKDPQNNKATQDLKSAEESIQKLGEKIMKNKKDELTKKIDESILKKINNLSNGKEPPILLFTPFSTNSDVVQATFNRVKELVGCKDNSQDVRNMDNKIYVYRQSVKKLIDAVKAKATEAEQNGHAAKQKQAINIPDNDKKAKMNMEELRKYLQELKEKEKVLVKEVKEEKQNYKRKMTQDILARQENVFKMESEIVNHQDKRSKLTPS